MGVHICIYGVPNVLYVFACGTQRRSEKCKRSNRLHRQTGAVATFVHPQPSSNYTLPNCGAPTADSGHNQPQNSKLIS